MRPNLGFQPLSPALRQILSAGIAKREEGERVIVHHVTDSRGSLQVEVERNGPTLGVAFERIIMRVETNV